MMPGTERIVYYLDLLLSRSEEQGAYDQIHGIRLRYSYDGGFSDLNILQVPMQPQPLPHPLSVGSDGIAAGWGRSEMTLSGPEGFERAFLDLLEVKGWKLTLTQRGLGQPIEFKLVLRGRWPLDAPVHYFPGSQSGEVVIRSHDDLGESVQGLGMAIPWPFTYAGMLLLRNPKRAGNKWRSGMLPTALGSVLEATGPVLRSMTMGLIDVKAIVKKVLDALELDSSLGELEDFLYFETGTDASGHPEFELQLGTPGETDLAEFGSMRLVLLGRVVLALRGELIAEYLENAFQFRMEGEAEGKAPGLRLEGPLVRQFQDGATTVRAVADMLPSSLDIPPLPEIKLEYRFDHVSDGFELPYTLDMGRFKLPARWDAAPVQVSSGLSFLQNLPLSIPEGVLDSLSGFQLGTAAGANPGVELLIKSAKQEKTETALSLELEMLLTLVVFGKTIPLKGNWRMEFNWETLAFDPAAGLRLQPESTGFSIGDLHIEGLNTLAVEWGAGQLTMKASSLRAYYDGVSEEGDDSPGFELLVTNLLIDSGGVDIDLELVGGTPKVSGIGESFKGAAGAISFRRSVFEFGYITAEGPLPWLDNATGSITLTFGRGFELEGVKGEFQLGLHHKTDWWVEIDLKSVTIDLDLSGDKPSLILMITGNLGIKPPDNAGGIFKYFKEIDLGFKDLVLTKSFDRLPPGLSLNVVLTESFTVPVLGIFDFEIRSIGIGSGFDPGGAALSLGGQIFFSSNDTKNTDPEYHKFKIGSPSLGSFMPRFALENLPFDVDLKPTLHATGKVQFKDTPNWKGFIGEGTLTINGKISIACLFEFSNKKRASDGAMLRVWMVYAEWQNFDVKLLGDFYLRDIGMGFGWRKTLKVLEEPAKLLSDSFEPAQTMPHKAEAWVDDMEGDPASWTVVMSAWITMGKGDRTKVSMLVGNILLALRSDLTVLLLVRAWVFNALDAIKDGPDAKNPPVIGMVYYSPPAKHLIAALIVRPGTPPKGVPPAMVKALIGNPFTFILETKPGLFRLELGNPRQLTFPLGAWTGRAGFFILKMPGALTIGISFEIAIDRAYSYGLSFGIGRLSIDISIYVGIWGLLAARIGNRAALYGEVGVFALVYIGLYLRIEFSFKLFWKRITIRFSFGLRIELSITAMVAFGVSDAGFGMRGEARASLRIWKFGFSASVSFSMGTAALNEARSRVFEGTSMAGDEDWKPERYLPKPVLQLRQAGLEAIEPPRWSVLHCVIGDEIYVLLLPEKGSWLATPAFEAPGEEPEHPSEDALTTADYESVEGIADYEWHIELEGAALTSHTEAARAHMGKTLRLKHTVNWNADAPMPDPPAETAPEDTTPFRLGDLLFEGEAMREEYRTLQYCLAEVMKHPEWKPELIEDERVRSAESAADPEETAGLRPDVRSPRFAKDTGYYDIALAEAFRYPAAEALSWQTMAVAYTDWAKGVMDELAGEMALKERIEQGESNEDPLSEPLRIDFLLNGDETYAHRTSEAQELEVLRSIENFTGRRNGMLGNLIREYSTWVEASRRNEGVEPVEQGFHLKQSGLAFRFRIEPGREEDFRIQFAKGIVNGATPQTVKDIRGGTITPDTPELGFSRKDHTYRIIDLLEFQDENGIHFSWVFELITPDQEHISMTHRDASGLYVENEAWFEHFSHYRVERENLAGDNNDRNQVKTWEIKPAYVPAYVQTDVNPDGTLPNRKLFVVAPRFDFSDLFEEPTEVGDPLIYRITAVDVFGNTSHFTEWYTTRKELAPPPPPEKGKLEYTARLEPGKAEESLRLHITPNRNLSEWDGGKLRYEIWTRSFPLTTSGFYGGGNDVGEEALNEGQSGNSTEGMTLVALLPEEVIEWSIADTQAALKQLEYGKVHAFFVRSVSRAGNASRLMRCEHHRFVGRMHDDASLQLCGYLERIPPPDPAAPATQFLLPEEMRQEVRPLSLPVLVSATDPRPQMQVSSDPVERELTIRMLHKPALDAAGHHPTGGYEVFVRDRDATIKNDGRHYRQQTRLEVVAPFVFAFAPPDSVNPQQWEVHAPPAIPADALLRLRWSEDGTQPRMLELADYLAGSPEGVLAHPDFSTLLKKLQAKATAEKWELTYAGGLSSASVLGVVSFDALLGRFSEKDDPIGVGLLRWLGRSVDLCLMGANHALGSVVDAHEWMTDWLDASDTIQYMETNEEGEEELYTANYGRYTLLIECLLNSDRQTEMGYFRLSLLPRIESIDLEAEEDKETALALIRQEELTNFMGQLKVLGNNGAQVTALSAGEKTWGQYTELMRPMLARHHQRVGQLHACDLSWLVDSGAVSRPLNPDATVSLQLRFKELYAKQLEYRLVRLSRYHALYQNLHLAEQASVTSFEQPGLLVRLPRVQPPKPPSIQFLGNFDRGGVFCSEWLIHEHEEEQLVQSNETYRNRLGYRGLAWSLFCNVKPGWREHSGWEEERSWNMRPIEPEDDLLPGLSQDETEIMNADAAWEGELALPPDAGLAGHPFTELLKPKGTVIRVPALPYYYAYRLGAFSRSDDVDSHIRLSDASPALPTVLPQLDRGLSGWKKLDEETIEVWWRIPSAWQSLTEAQQKLWANEKPFANRLWDSDISYTLRIVMQSTQITLALVKPLSGKEMEPNEKGEKLPANVPLYQLTTPGKYLYVDEQKLEQQPVHPASPFMPELRITLKATDAFKPFLHSQDEFLEMVCSRPYGTVRQTEPLSLRRAYPPMEEIPEEPTDS